MDKVFIGFIGALLALILTALFTRFTNALKFDRMRNSIIHYLKKIAQPKLDRYKFDCLQAIKHCKLIHLSIDDRGDGYDDMPMLTSEIFKSYSQTDLLIVMNTPAIYAELLNLLYGIEFLKKNMPVSLYNNFAEKTNKHLEDKNIPAGEKQFEHISTCRSIAEYREESIHDLNLKIKTTDYLIKNLELIIQNLEGGKSKWLWKYFWAY